MDTHPSRVADGAQVGSKTPLYQRILLAYDGSLGGRLALREGALLALRCKASVYLLSVSGAPMGFRSPDSAYPSARAYQYDYLRSVLEEGVEWLMSIGLSPASRLAVGDPAEEIRRYSDVVGADLVIVGHRRQNLADRWWSGSDAASLASQINCSLLISRTAMSDLMLEAELRRLGQTSLAGELDTSLVGDLSRTLGRRTESEAQRA